jgi:hypothetical protein
MKKIILSLFCFVVFFAGKTHAQSADNVGFINLATYIDASVEHKTEGATQVLANKLDQIVTTNGLSNGFSRFILTANVVTVTKDVIGTAPTSVAYTLTVTFYIGDGFDGNKFATVSKNVKGVGINETKAFINAFKNINASDSQLQSFIDKGKKEIINYYNSRCDLIIKQARLLETQNQFDEAIFLLTSIPDACTDCFAKSIAVVEEIFEKKINMECKLKLQEAKLLWASNPTFDGASLVAEILNDINPRATCFKEVVAFTTTVAKRVLELDGREWQFTVDKEIGLERDRIKAMRDIGVAWGNGQPKSVVYNVRGWW